MKLLIKRLIIKSQDFFPDDKLCQINGRLARRFRSKHFFPPLSTLLLLITLAGCAGDGQSVDTNFPGPVVDVTPESEPPPWLFFIGNSLTYVYDIPGKLDRLIRNNGGYPEGYEGYLQNTPGGAILYNRIRLSMRNSELAMQILLKRPAYIVLQEQSNGIGNYTCYYIGYYLALAKAIEAEVLIYQTWQRLGIFMGVYEYYGTAPEDLQNLARLNDLAMVPNGAIWDKLLTDNVVTPPVLYGDDIHQTALGAALNAAAFFYTLRPDISQIPGLLAQTGQSIPTESDNTYNQVIYNTVRDPSLPTRLRGSVRNLYPDSASDCHDQNMTVARSSAVTADTMGNTLATAIALENTPTQTVNVDIGKNDLDIYRLPTVQAGQSLRLEIPATCSFCSFATPNTPFSWGTVVFLANENGQAIPYTLSNENDTLTFIPPAGANYLILIGDNYYISSDQFTMTVTILTQ